MPKFECVACGLVEKYRTWAQVESAAAAHVAGCRRAREAHTPSPSLPVQPEKGV